MGGTGDVEGSEDFTLLTLVTLLRVHLEDSPGDCPSSIVGEVGVEVTTGVDTSCCCRKECMCACACVHMHVCMCMCACACVHVHVYG